MRSQWEVLYDDLKRRIGDGVYQPGHRMPTEHELSAVNGVSRNTVRRAYLALSQDGLIRIVNGRGSYVMQNGIVYEIDAVSKFRDVLEGQGVSCQTKLVDCTVVNANPEIAEKLELIVGAKVLRDTSIILGDAVPFMVATRYFPLELMTDFRRRFAQSGSFTTLLAEEELGVLKRAYTTIGARLPTNEEASLLQSPSNAPLLDVTALGRLSDGQAVEWQHVVMNSQLIRLSFRP